MCCRRSLASRVRCSFRASLQSVGVHDSSLVALTAHNHIRISTTGFLSRANNSVIVLPLAKSQALFGDRKHMPSFLAGEHLMGRPRKYSTILVLPLLGGSNMGRPTLGIRHVLGIGSGEETIQVCLVRFSPRIGMQWLRPIIPT